MNIANMITLLRLLLTPVVIWLLLEKQAAAAFVFFVFAGITDAADGMIARFFGQVTETGAYLDPLADKVLLVGIFITLGAMGALPVWLVLLVVSRDVLIVGGVLLSLTLGFKLEMHPLLISKANTVAQIALASLVLGRMALSETGIMELPVLIIDGLIWLAAATTALSGGAYIFVWATATSKESGAGDHGSK